MEAVAEAATAETTAAATAAMIPQANVAEATEGEVAAATPAEAVTAITSHPISSPYTLSVHQLFICLFVSKIYVALCVHQEKWICCI
jgi:hypothetical protein